MEIHSSCGARMRRSPAPWIIRPDYGKDNVYRLWDKHDNYHHNTSPEAMDANARLMEQAPTLLHALRLAKTALLTMPVVGAPYDQRHSDTHMRALIDIQVAITRAHSRTKRTR